MLSQSLKTIAWAVALAALPGFTSGEPPTVGERALLGWVSSVQAGSSNLSLVGTHGQVTAARALLGKLSVREAPGVAEESIQIRPHPIDGSSTLLGH